jgi:N-carbamoylputrescine amidase
MTSQTVRVAAIQVVSHDGAVEANLARATTLVAEAAAGGARLVLCPEFLAAGYRYDESIWESGERRAADRALADDALAAAHRIYIGASYLEAEGDDFFNTFTLAAPDGSIAGRVRKESLPACEGWYFKGCKLPKTIDTALGRIAVGICQDNHTARFMRRIADTSPDLILMPHSAPCVPFVDALMRDNLSEVGPFYAREFGVPVVREQGAHAPLPDPRRAVRTPAIHVPRHVDDHRPDARVVAQLPDREGVVIGDGRARSDAQAATDGPARVLVAATGAHSPPRSCVLRGDGATRKRAYAENPARAVAARAV